MYILYINIYILESLQKFFGTFLRDSIVNSTEGNTGKKV